MRAPSRQRCSRDALSAYVTERMTELQGVIAKYREGIKAAATVEKQKDYSAWAVLSRARVAELRKLAKQFDIEVAE